MFTSKIIVVRGCSLVFSPQNTEGNTAVYLSSQTFRCDVTRQLLEAGADPSVIGMHSCNAFLLASIKEFFP